MCITTPKQESFTQNWENIQKESRHTHQCTSEKQIFIHNTCNTLRKKLESKHRMYVLYITDHGVHSPFGVPCVQNIKENYIHMSREKRLGNIQ